MTGEQARLFSKVFAELFKGAGAAFVLINTGQSIVPLLDVMGDRALLSITPERKATRIMGPSVTPKAVRAFLWRNRGRSVDRKASLLWAVYDPKKDLTFMGLGAIVNRAVAERMRDRGSGEIINMPMEASHGAG